MQASYRIIQGDCRDTLKTLPEKSVHCCVTSPPYYNLRDYGVDGQIGLEATPGEYIAKLVDVFREVKRVLRDDGTLWVNMGDSYATTGKNRTEAQATAASTLRGGTATQRASLKQRSKMSSLTCSMNHILKSCLVFGLNASTTTPATKGINVSLNNQGAPKSVLASLFSTKRECVEDGDNAFTEVLNFLAVPGNGIAGGPLGFMATNKTAPDIAMQIMNGISIVIPHLNADLQSELAVLRSSRARASHGNNAPLTVKESNEPITEPCVRWHSNWDAFTTASCSKGIPDIDFMYQTVALRNGHLAFAGNLSDFRVTQAAAKKVTFTSIQGGLIFTVSNVGHLWFSFPDGSVVPYRTVYEKSIRRSNRFGIKQEIGIPHMLKEALQEDGWICRQTIIWHKPNPMPESVTDRCTKAHEYLFLLSKSPRYFFDAEAIKEPATYAGQPRGGSKNRYEQNDAGMDCKEYATRNKRSVWSVKPASFKGAHFAVFPPKLIEPCILAGCPEGGTVLDPFAGSGTTAEVALKAGRNAVLCELNPEYLELQKKRLAFSEQMMLI